jgi:hypothetical protein
MYRRKTKKHFLCAKSTHTNFNQITPLKRFQLLQIQEGKMKSHFKSFAIAALTIAVALLSFRVYAASPKPQPTPAPQPQVWTPGCIASVPKSWGTFRGASTQSGIAFEDASGTIRFLTNIPCDGILSVSLEIHRTAVTTQ